MWSEAYLESKVFTASPVKLVQLLYDGAIRFVREAREYLASAEIAKRSEAIGRAMAILTELTASLDHTQGGEISRNLAGLYDYMQNRLLHANLHQSDEALVEILGLLTTLSEAWESVDAELGQGAEPENTVGNQSPRQAVWEVPLAEEPVGTYGWTL